MNPARTTIGGVAGVLLVSGCGDDGNDGYLASLEPIEIAVVSGADADHGVEHDAAAAHADGEAGDHDAAEDASTSPQGDLDTEGDGHHGHHGDAAVLVLDAGQSGELMVTFDDVGEFIIGCHIPGHWEAGMRATIAVI